MPSGRGQNTQLYLTIARTATLFNLRKPIVNHQQWYYTILLERTGMAHHAQLYITTNDYPRSRPPTYVSFLSKASFQAQRSSSKAQQRNQPTTLRIFHATPRHRYNRNNPSHQSNSPSTKRPKKSSKRPNKDNTTDSTTQTTTHISKLVVVIVAVGRSPPSSSSLLVGRRPSSVVRRPSSVVDNNNNERTNERTNERRCVVTAPVRAFVFAGALR